MTLKILRLGTLTDAQELERFLEVAVQVVDALGELHQGDLVHGSIRPQEILIDDDTGEVRLGGLGISALIRGQMSLYDEAYLREYLPYISPEQTGRMNSSVDHRSDFYSLGITFYELLSGKPPFQADDPLELIHAHIARNPQPLVELNGNLPEVLSEIVMKLLAKNAEERYQSAFGLRVDLYACLTQLRQRGEIVSFALGREDVPERLTIPQKLYGREAEIAELLSAFEGVAQGDTQVVLVSGHAGIGKTALVQEVQKLIVQQRAYFIMGKFDPYQPSVPYASLTQAFGGLIRQILTESDQQVETWRERLEQALGRNAQIIIDAIPEVELVIGPQPPVSELPPTEAQNRFNFVVQNFVHTFATQEHPLVLFLDDMQWADRPSLNLVAHLLAHADTKYLLVIGAYRESDVDPGHPLSLMLGEIEESGKTIRALKLGSLSATYVDQLVADTLHSEIEPARPLAQQCLEKTAGNPFFLNQFLMALYEDEHLYFERKLGQWRWDLEAIQDLRITDNVLDLMAGKIRKLSEPTQLTLQLAACVGSAFDLDTLAEVSEKSPGEVVIDLQSAVKEGLILPPEEGGHFREITKQGRQSYCFLHDRVQQAAYSLIAEDLEKEIHLKIGRLMLENSPQIEQDEKLLDIVAHLNRGVELIISEVEFTQLARLNLLAGQRAKAAVAYEPALSYLRAGTDILRVDRWGTQYELCYALHMELAECEYLSGNLDQAEMLFDIILNHAGTNLDKAKVYRIKLALYQNIGQSQQALDCGIEGLRLMGYRLPVAPSKIAILVEILRAKLLIGRRSAADLLELPEMSDPNIMVVTDLLVSITPPAYFLNKDLFSLAVLKMLNLSLRYGNTQGSSFAYTMYGFILGSVLGDFETGYEFGQMALELNERSNDMPSKCESYMTFGGFITHWRKHIRECYEYLVDGYRAGLESGDFMYAGYCAGFDTAYRLFDGTPLDELDKRCRQYLPVLEKINHRVMYIGVTGVHRAGLDFRDAAHAQDGYDEAAYIAEMKREGMDFVYYLYCAFKLAVHYSFENYHEALEMALDLHENIDQLLGMFHCARHNFYFSLTMAAVYENASPRDQKQYWKILKANQKQMRKWAANCPENFQHKYLLVAAEMARIRGDVSRAKKRYGQAVEAARQSGFLQNEALALELAAKFYLANDQLQKAQLFMREARNVYTRWGAEAKVEHLDGKYAQLLSSAQSPMARSEPSMAETKPDSGLDLVSVLNASLALSSEIRLDKLLETLMGIVIENAGARRGFLILYEDGQLTIEAEGMVGASVVTLMRSIPLESRDDLSQGLVNYVVRTKEDVVLSDSVNEGPFTEDPYFKEHRPKSVLCAPIIKQTQLIGLLYLENNLITNAFTPDRLEVLQVLSAQAAISLENARFYGKLNQLNMELKAEIEERVRAQSELQTAHDELELRVQERTAELDAYTRALETSYQVSRRLSTFLDENELVREVVDQIQRTFDYYHAQLFLLDQRQDNLVVMAGSGEAGQAILEAGHVIPMGEGLVGKAAQSNQAMLAADVLVDEQWLPNPLLPDTRCELAVPISLGDKVLGILDVQDDRIGSLTHADAALLGSIANQVAIALQNARAYTHAQRRAEREQLISSVSQRIQAATTVEDVLQIAARELGQALGKGRSKVELKASLLRDDGHN